MLRNVSRKSSAALRGAAESCKLRLIFAGVARVSSERADLVGYVERFVGIREKSFDSGNILLRNGDDGRTRPAKANTEKILMLKVKRGFEPRY
jgi:hypothetical protein